MTNTEQLRTAAAEAWNRVLAARPGTSELDEAMADHRAAWAKVRAAR